jgi:hypothetical protein
MVPAPAFVNPEQAPFKFPLTIKSVEEFGLSATVKVHVAPKATRHAMLGYPAPEPV